MISSLTDHLGVSWEGASENRLCLAAVEGGIASRSAPCGDSAGASESPSTSFAEVIASRKATELGGVEASAILTNRNTSFAA